MPDFKAVIFDMDGVIIDSEPLHEEAKRRAFAKYGLVVPEEVYQQFKGKTDWDVLLYAAETYGDGSIDVRALIADKQAAYAILVDELQLIPGARAFIQSLADQGVPLALTTSATQRNQHRAFDKFNLHAYFPIIVTADDITHAKPHPQPYLRTVEKLGLAAKACLVIEDSYNGVRSAIAAGCVVVGITTSFEEPKLKEAGAHYVVDTFPQLEAMIGV